MLNCMLVGIGGMIGAVCRYLVGLLPVAGGSGFPVKTLLINAAGSFAIGMIAAAAERNALSPQLVLLLKVGVCGGFTTFSTFAFETGELLRRNAGLLAFLYVLSSVMLSVSAVFAARLLMRRILL